jgi:hypothetical protein
MELKLDVLGVHGKLVKYVIHLFERKNWKQNIVLQRNSPNNNQLVLGFKGF